MSSSVTERSALREAFIALVISLLCAIGGGVYELFSHGVWSGFMVYAFLFPLTLVALPGAWFVLRGKPQPSHLTRHLHHAGTATLTVGAFIQGALDIYGTSNQLTTLYWIAGILLLLLAAVTHLTTRHST